VEHGGERRRLVTDAPHAEHDGAGWEPGEAKVTAVARDEMKGVTLEQRDLGAREASASGRVDDAANEDRGWKCVAMSRVGWLLSACQMRGAHDSADGDELPGWYGSRHRHRSLP